MVATHPHSNSSGTEASRSEPCPLCNRDHYCYQIKDDDGETLKVLCNWTAPHTPPSGWQHIGTASDGRPIFTNQGSKRQRRGKKYPEVISLQPQAKTDIPQWQDVQIPVGMAERGHAVKIQPELGLGHPETIYQLQEIKAGSRQGQQTLLAILTVLGSPYGGTLEIPLDALSSVVTHDPQTGAKEQFIEYFYSDDCKTVRRQWTDRRAIYNGKTKEIRPYHQCTDGSWTKGKGESQPPLYRQSEAEATILAGGIVMAVGGEQTVEHLRLLGLTAVCNQGGEGGYRQIAQDLAPVFALAVENELKPLLAVWPDHDETGRQTFGSGLLKECYKNGVTAVAIDPLALWPNMPPGGDAYDWINHGKQSGLSDSEMLRQLEFAIDYAIDRHFEEIRHRFEREAWEAPMTNNGEIGRWLEPKQGEQTIRKWKPLCNFDFQVERELEDAFGGGLVLQVKRSFEKRQYRVILNSKDYTSVDKFVDALKLAMGTGVVCNLTKHELGALIHTRLHEYRTNRQGKVYKRISRYGQQDDGTWVFRERQYAQNGQPTSEEQTGWVFSDVSSEGDEIPCPELAPENPLALKALVDATRKFFGRENFYQVLLMMGWVVAGLHSQAIFKDKRWFPLINAHGEPGSCKTLAAEAALSLVGMNWSEHGMLARASASAIYEHGSKTGALPFIWDDPDRNPQNEEIAKTWANWKARVVRYNRQEPHSPMGLTSNHVFGGDQAATYTRLVRLPFERAQSGANSAFQELQTAQSLASGAFPTLLAIDYPKAAIAAIELELLSHLPKAHARIAQALAIVVYYAQKLVELAAGTEDVKRWAIQQLCPSEDDADSAGNSLQDFIDKVLSLESESLVGDWNKQTITTRDGQRYMALHYADVWSLVDKHYKPATYNLKALKPLVVKAGGRVDNCTQKFDASRDETLAYYRAQISPRLDSDGATVKPNPPRKVGRKAWLLPISLFNGGDDSNDGDGGSGDNNPNSPNPDAPQNFREFNPVTDSYQKLPNSGNLHNPDGISDSGTDSRQVTKLPKNLNQTELKLTSKQTDSDCHNEIPNNSVTEVTPVTPVTLVTQLQTKAVTQEVSQLQPTNFGNSPVTVDNYPVAKIFAPTPPLGTTAEAETKVSQSPASALLRGAPTVVAAKEASSPAAPAEICRGQRVRVHCFGSQRDGLTGVVRELMGTSKAMVWLDDATIRSDLRRWECPLSWLEVLRE